MFALENTANNSRNYAENHLPVQCDQNYAKLTFVFANYMT